MSKQDIRCVDVWPPLLRLAHWLMAAGVSFQLVSAWVIANSTADLGFWRDYHLIVGQLMVFVLLLRGWLLLQRGTGGWRSFVPTRAQLDGAGQMLKFYMSLFRFPLPNWYAYNPLWQLVYPLMLACTVLAVVSGLLHDSTTQVFGVDAAAVHGAATSLLGALVLLHIATAVLQDWKGRGATTSAMLNGRRYFHIESEGAVAPPRGAAEVRIDPASIGKRPSDWRPPG